LWSVRRADGRIVVGSVVRERPAGGGPAYGGGAMWSAGADVRGPDDAPGRRVAVMVVAERVFRRGDRAARQRGDG